MGGVVEVVDAQATADVDDLDVAQGVGILRDDLVELLEELGVDGDVVDCGAEVAVESLDRDLLARLEDLQNLSEVSVNDAELGISGN